MQTILFCQAIFKRPSQTTWPIWGAIINVICWISFNVLLLAGQPEFLKQTLCLNKSEGDCSHRGKCFPHWMREAFNWIETAHDRWGDRKRLGRSGLLCIVKSLKLLFVSINTSYGFNISKPKEQVNEIFVLMRTILPWLHATWMYDFKTNMLVGTSVYHARTPFVICMIS